MNTETFTAVDMKHHVITAECINTHTPEAPTGNIQHAAHYELINISS